MWTMPYFYLTGNLSSLKPILHFWLESVFLDEHIFWTIHICVSTSKRIIHKKPKQAKQKTINKNSTIFTFSSFTLKISSCRKIKCRTTEVHRTGGQWTKKPLDSKTRKNYTIAPPLLDLDDLRGCFNSWRLHFSLDLSCTLWGITGRF